MNLETLSAELAKLGYRPIKVRKPRKPREESKPRAPALTIWEKRRIARAYKGPTLAQCEAARARPEHVAAQVRDLIRVSVYGAASNATHTHVGPRRLLLTSQYMHLTQRGEAKARPVESLPAWPEESEAEEIARLAREAAEAAEEPAFDSWSRANDMA